MRTFSIPINKDNVINAVKHITGFTAKNTENGMDRVAVTDDEAGLTDKLFAEAISGLASKLYDFQPVVMPDKIIIVNSSSFPEKTILAISNIMESYLINDICYRWFFVARQADDAKLYNGHAAAALNDMIPMFYQRKRP